MTFEEYMKLGRKGKMKARFNDLALVAAAHTTVGEQGFLDTTKRGDLSSEDRKDYFARTSRVSGLSPSLTDSFTIYPTLELHDGRCVSFPKGRLDYPQVWHVDPVETACSFAAAGASWMHITDINALAGTGNNNVLIEEIIRATGISVQLGGGFRSRDLVASWIDKGASRIVISTMATHYPDLFRKLAENYPDQITLSIDVFNGKVMTEGWRVQSEFTPEAFIQRFDSFPLAGIVLTDIESDIEYGDVSLSLITDLAAQTRHPVIVRGVVRTNDDVALLRYVPNVSGTLIGRQILSKDIDLHKAIALAQSNPEQIAAFL